MHIIYVDADACAVKDEIYRVALRLRWRVVVVANQFIQTPRSALVSAVKVSQGSDVADDYIAERCEAGDLVITADIPLAARALEAGARALGPKGREFLPESIGDALASRALSQHLRELGIDGGGPAPMAPKDRSRFLQALDRVMQAVLRQHPKP